MKIPETEQYTELKSHLRYLNEKIIEAFSRFITMGMAIIGGVFYIHITLDPIDPRRYGIWLPSSAAFTLVGIGTIIIIIQNSASWNNYRKTLSKCYPEISLSVGPRTWIRSSSNSG
jgi:hypothetical protein